MWGKAKKKASDFWNDQSGSESLEFLVSSISMFMMILAAVILFSYVVELNLVNTATKSVTRTVEVTGKYNTSSMASDFKKYMGNSSSLVFPSSPITVSNVSNALSGNRIQLKGTFKVTGSATYIISVIHPFAYNGFNINLPLKSTVTGMSEVYWQS